MKRKSFFFIGVTLGVLLFILLVFNARYPFITPKAGSWSVGYATSVEIFPKMNVNSQNIITYEAIDELLPQKIHYIADPFFIKKDSVFYLFVEIKGEGNANIALFTSKNGKKYSYQGIVLDEEFHLSYPQVFKYKDEFYMLPESKQAGQVILYKAENFPYHWKPADTLIENVRFKDPSILLSDELNLIVAVDDEMKQYFYTADSLTGQWAEVENYTKKWGNETRPGGRFFKWKKNWYLPIQDRTYGYGSGISLYRLLLSNGQLSLQLAKKQYLSARESIPWFNRGMHQLDIQCLEGKWYAVYDGDRNLNGEKDFQIKRTIKYNLIDIYNYFFN